LTSYPCVELVLSFEILLLYSQNRIPKFQLPNPKFQIISNHQAPNTKRFSFFKIWSLGFWLLFGYWCLGFGDSQAALSSPSFVGKTSPLKIHTFTPMIP
jgi:hypothetical protein